MGKLERRGLMSSGNFAEELGEDFLGLRELGIDREFGLNSLTVPSSLFYGRRKRQAGAGSGYVALFTFFTSFPVYRPD